MILPFICQRLQASHRQCLRLLRKHYSTRGTTAVLRPFILAVHPDLLWQHPTKREVNENSLKHLNQFIESLQSNTSPAGPDILQFYLRKNSTDQDHQLVNIALDRTSLSATVSSILSSCNLPVPPSEETFQHAFDAHSEESLSRKCFFHRKLPAVKEETEKRRVSQSPNIDLLNYLSKKSGTAQSLVRGMHAASRATLEYSEEMKSHLKLKDIVWDNRWTWLQNRNCIEDLVRLSKQYHSQVHHLAGRTLVFGDTTGFHLNGDIVFGCRDSRRLWIELLENIPKHNEQLLKIWKTDAQLEEHLQGAKIVHSIWKPSRELGRYLFAVEKLAAAFANSASSCGFFQEPSGDDAFRISVDIDSSEMRVLVNGDIVLSPEIPVSDIEMFLKNNMDTARARMESHKSETAKEVTVHEKCMKSLALGFLYRDVNLSPDKMRKCCERLIDGQKKLRSKLQNLHLCISSYYIISEDGIVCIPWDWKAVDL